MTEQTAPRARGLRVSMRGRALWARDPLTGVRVLLGVTYKSPRFGSRRRRSGRPSRIDYTPLSAAQEKTE